MCPHWNIITKHCTFQLGRVGRGKSDGKQGGDEGGNEGGKREGRVDREGKGRRVRGR